MVKVQYGEELLPKVSTLSVGRRAHERYRQTTDGFAIAKNRTRRSHVRVKTGTMSGSSCMAIRSDSVSECMANDDRQSCDTVEIS